MKKSSKTHKKVQKNLTHDKSPQIYFSNKSLQKTVPYGLMIIALITGLVVWYLVNNLQEISTDRNVCAAGNRIIMKANMLKGSFVDKYTQACRESGGKLTYDQVNKNPDQYKVFCGRRGERLMDEMLSKMKRQNSDTAPKCNPEIDALCPKPASQPSLEEINECQKKSQTTGTVRYQYKMQLIRHWDNAGGKCFYAWECQPEGMGSR